MSDSWASVLSRARRSVVQIRSVVVRSFDSNDAGPLIGTAFIVDRALGILLTNHHVVTSAPSVAQALFYSDVEVPLSPLYIDPIHDFGFFKYDPNLIKDVQVEELKLNPSGVKPGMEIRVVGSDAGERSMVLRGTISRIDRNPPEYEYGSGFCDHNTYYITAACDTSGGSSGSPIIDRTGTVVALNAGASVDAASSFFLPVDRAVIALEKLRLMCLGQLTEPLRKSLPRGTIQCVFTSATMPECKRLGVDEVDEARMRSKTKNKGLDLLVVESVVVQGPADRAGLKRGDVLLSLDNVEINHCLDLEKAMDASLLNGKPLKLELKRGKERLIKEILASDAYDFFPNSFLEFSGGTLHQISFAHARDFRFPLSTVVIQSPGYELTVAEMPADIAILSVDGNAIRSIEDLVKILRTKANNEAMLVRYAFLVSKFEDDITCLRMDRRWFPPCLWTRDPNNFGKWVKEEIGLTQNGNVQSDAIAKLNSVPLIPLKRMPSVSKHGERVLRSLVMVKFNMPLRMDGVSHQNYAGTGYICDVEAGLVITDRNTVVSAFGDAQIEFTGSKSVKATIEFLHPWHNFVVLRFNTALLTKGEKAEVGSIEFFEASEDAASPPQLENPQEEKDEGKSTKIGREFKGNVPEVHPGDVLDFYGISKDLTLTHLPRQKVLTVERGTVFTLMRPRFTSKNFEQIKFDTKAGIESSLGGVYVDSTGKVRAILSSYVFDENESEAYIATSSGAVKRILDQVRRGQFSIPTLACEFGIISLNRARNGFGMPPEWARKVSKAADDAGLARECLKVWSVMAGSPPSRSLKSGDVLLAIDGIVSCDYTTFEIACLRAANRGDSKHVSVTLLRDGQLMENIRVDLAELSARGTRRVVSWAGMWVQPTLDAVRWHGFVPPKVAEGKDGCYVSALSAGSPAHESGVLDGCWIIEINGREVSDADELIEVARQYKDDKTVRVRLTEWQGTDHMFTLDLNSAFWPTVELAFDDELKDWKRKTLF